MILEPSFLAAGQESKRNIKNLSFWVEQFLARITRITQILYAIIIALPTLAPCNPCNPCLIYTLGKKLMTHPHLFVEFFYRVVFLKSDGFMPVWLLNLAEK